MKKLLLLVLFIVFTFCSHSQTLLVVVNADSKVYVDGDEKGKVKADDALKVKVSKGQHYIQAKGKWNGTEKTVSKTITISDETQTMVNLTFSDDVTEQATAGAITPITVADIGVKIPGTMEVNSWKNANQNKPYPDYPKFYYGFEKGDEIIINYTSNTNSSNEIEIKEYHGVIKYSNTDFKELKDIRFKVDERGIFGIIFSTKHLGTADGNLTIQRVPASESAKNFNCGVEWKEVNDTTYTEVEERYLVKSDTTISNFFSQETTVHSMSNHNGDKNTPEFTIPPNTIAWSYYIGVNETKSSAFTQATVKATNSVASTISKLPGYGPLSALALYGISYFVQLHQGDGVDFYITDYNNATIFARGGQPSAAFKDGKQIVNDFGQIKSPLNGTYYICLKNNNYVTPIDVTIKMSAIVVNQQWATKPIKKMNVVTKRVPFNSN